jgi:hypothetical protein
MIKKSLAIACLFIASVAWAGNVINPDDVKIDTKEKIAAELKEKEAKLKAIQEEIKIKFEKWQQDLKSGPVGRFQAVAMGQSGVIILDTKEGRVWAAGATPETGPKIVYMGQVNPYPLPGK